MKFMLCCLLWLGMVFPMGQAQKLLSLENPKKFKRILFQPGDYIRFQGQDGQAKYEGIIESIDESFVVLVKSVQVDGSDQNSLLYRDYVPISEIRAVINSRPSPWRTFRNGYYATAILGGGMFIGLTTINTLTQDTSPDPTTLIVATGLLTSGLALRYLGRDKFKIGKRWQLRAIEPMILEELEANQ
ncbi:MAG: hypothetical protein AAF399_29700 [Bacteroidota bacterium]